MPLCASLQLRQVFRCPFDWAKADVPGTSRVHSVDRPFRPAQRSGQPFFRTSRSGIPLSANGPHRRTRQAPTADPGIRLTNRPEDTLSADGGGQSGCSPSVRTPKQLSYLTAIRHSVPRPICIRPGEKERNPPKRSGAAHRPPPRRIAGKRAKRIPHRDTDYRPHSAQTSRPPRKTRRIRGVE